VREDATIATQAVTRRRRMVVWMRVNKLRATCYG
jgi:hypothetical protein